MVLWPQLYCATHAFLHLCFHVHVWCMHTTAAVHHLAPSCPHGTQPLAVLTIKPHPLQFTYRTRPNYCTYLYKGTVKQFRSRHADNSWWTFYLLYTGICCGYPFDLHRLSFWCNSNEYPQHMLLFKWVPTTYAFIKIRKKKSHKHHQISLCWSFFFLKKKTLAGRYIFYHKFSQ